MISDQSLYDAAMTAYEEEQARRAVRKTEAQAEYNRRKAALDDLKRQMFAKLTEHHLGLAIEADALPYPVTDEVTLSLGYDRGSLWGEYCPEIGEEMPKEVDRLSTEIKDWYLVASSQYADWYRHEQHVVDSLLKLGQQITAAATLRREREAENARRAEAMRTEARFVSHKPRYEFLSDIDLNRAERPFEIIAGPLYIPEYGPSVLVQYQDAEADKASPAEIAQVEFDPACELCREGQPHSVQAHREGVERSLMAEQF